MAAPAEGSLRRFSLAIDAMGGDHAPDSVLDGLELAAERHPQAQFLLFGDEARLRDALARRPRAAKICVLRHAPDAIPGDMKPTQALRQGRKSSMRMAIDAVASGEASGVVSAGNTGALMALAKIVIKTMPEISRPALAAIAPSLRGDVVMLDLGANVQCDARNLVEFTIMGDAFARAVLGLPSPTIGLLNVGSEELKGDDRVREAAEVLRGHAGLNFHGFVEGHDISAGTVDVVVTDGFTGNVALKTGEGVYKLMRELLKQVFTSSIPARMGYLLARPALERLREWMDPRRYNGAILLGLNGVVVKSHGGTDATGFAHAVDVAMDMVTHGFTQTIRESLSQLAAAPSPVAIPPIVAQQD
nr:phosphate acyltransferase PlsX [uncultured Roseococcus sp.]